MIRKIGFLSIGMFLVLLTACTKEVAFTSTVEGQSSQIATQVIVTPTSPTITSTLTAESPLIKTPGAHQTDSPVPQQDTSGMEAMVLRAKEDLSDHLGVAIDLIDLIQVEPVTWNDVSLGCPQAGREYPQVITPGFCFLLEVDGQEYTYHSDTAQRVVLCEVNGLPNEPVPLMPVAPKGKPPKCQWTPCP